MTVTSSAERPNGTAGLVRLIVLDQRRVVAEGLASMLREAEAFHIEAVVTTSDDFVRSIIARVPDVVVVGVGDDGAEVRNLLRTVVANRGASRVVGILGSSSIEAITELLVGGVSSVVSTSATVEQLKQAVFEALNSSTGAPSDAAVLVRRLRGLHAPLPETSMMSLSPREIEVLRAMTVGWSTARIADSLGISKNTVRAHAQHTIAKLGAHSRLEAAAVAIRLGLLDGDGDGERAGDPLQS